MTTQTNSNNTKTLRAVAVYPKKDGFKVGEPSQQHQAGAKLWADGTVVEVISGRICKFPDGTVALVDANKELGAKAAAKYLEGKTGKGNGQAKVPTLGTGPSTPVEAAPQDPIMLQVEIMLAEQKAKLYRELQLKALHDEKAALKAKLEAMEKSLGEEIAEMESEEENEEQEEEFDMGGEAQAAVG